MALYLPERNSVRSIGRPPGQHFTNTKRLLEYLERSGEVSETNVELASSTSLSTDQVERCLKTLREKGFVRVSKSYRSYVFAGQRRLMTSRVIKVLED